MNKPQMVGVKVPLSKTLHDLGIKGAIGEGIGFDSFVMRGYWQLKAAYTLAVAEGKLHLSWEGLSPGVKRGVQGHYVRILFPVETYRDIRMWAGGASEYYGKRVYMAEIVRAALRRALKSAQVDIPDEPKPPVRKNEVPLGTAIPSQSTLGKGAQSFLAMMEEAPKLEVEEAAPVVTAERKPDPDKIFIAAGPKEEESLGPGSTHVQDLLAHTAYERDGAPVPTPPLFTFGEGASLVKPQTFVLLVDEVIGDDANDGMAKPVKTVKRAEVLREAIHQKYMPEVTIKIMDRRLRGPGMSVEAFASALKQGGKDEP